MATVDTQSEYDMKITPVPDVFIDEYLPCAENPLFVTVYIFSFRYYSVGLELSVKDTAYKLNVSEDDVIDAWRYWQEKGIVKILDDSSENFAVEYLHIESRRQRSKRLSATQKPKTQINAEEATKGETKELKLVTVETAPIYSVPEIEKLQKSDKQIRYLFSVAERMLAKPLTYNEMNVFLGFYDWLRLPIAVIEVMLDYCISNNHKSVRYLEKVAMDWSDNAIDTVEEAEEYIRLFNTDYREIMKSFGLMRRDPNPKEIAYMKKWLREFKMPIEIVKEACNKTIFQIGQPKFTYADAILTKWNEQEVRTLDEINALEDEFYKNIEQKAGKAKRQAGTDKKTAKNGFNQYEKREWDFDKLMEMEQIYIDKQLKENNQ